MAVRSTALQIATSSPTVPTQPLVRDLRFITEIPRLGDGETAEYAPFKLCPKHFTNADNQLILRMICLRYQQTHASVDIYRHP